MIKISKLTKNSMTALLTWLAISLPICAQVGSQEETQAAKPEPAKTRTEKTPALVDGLLDLLNEPPIPQSQSDGKPNGDLPPLQPADVGLDGEDLGEQADRPLQSVRQSMLIAAGFLERGVTNSQTQTLQNDIVQRLNDVIAQLEQPNEPATEQNEQQSASNSASSHSQASTQKNGRRPLASGNEGDNPDGSTSTPAGEDTPGQRGKAASGQVRLADPKALQERIWGQLPERMRRQMQSRVVERFLPSYREQIEAYFQALLREPTD